MAKSVDETQSKTPVIRSIDIGFGFTKYNKMVDGELVYDSFISLAPRSSKIESLDMLNDRETVVVNIDGSEYEVGPDSYLLESVDSTRTLNEQYINTTQYKALFYGALTYINEEVIDLLIVGLPVSNFKTQNQKLQESMKGLHKINNEKTVEVKNVLVVMQPMGALKYCLVDEELAKLDLDLKDSNNLIIDPGFFTFDFVMASGSKMIEKKSDSPAGGVNRVLTAIAESITNKIGKKYENYNAIDKGLRKRKLKIAGKDEDLLEHIKNTRSIIESPIIHMKNIVGDGADIDNILLVGGGASIFEKTIKEYYPDHKIIKLADSNLVNVKGYQAIGEENYPKIVK